MWLIDSFWYWLPWSVFTRLSKHLFHAWIYSWLLMKFIFWPFFLMLMTGLCSTYFCRKTIIYSALCSIFQVMNWAKYSTRWICKICGTITKACTISHLSQAGRYFPMFLRIFITVLFESNYFILFKLISTKLLNTPLAIGRGTTK